MKIAFIADVDVCGQFYMLSQAINKYTDHLARSITIAKTYIEYPIDIWLGFGTGRSKLLVPKEEADHLRHEAVLALKDIDMFVFLRKTWDFGLKIQFHPFNTILKTAGSDARTEPYAYKSLSDRGYLHVSNTDYTQGRHCGFNAYHMPLCIDFDLLPSFNPPGKGKIRIAHASTSRSEKRTDYIIETAKKYDNIELVLIERKPWREALKIKSTCDVNFDQVWAGGYGFSSIESWAMGQPSIGYVNGWVRSIFPDIPMIQVEMKQEPGEEDQVDYNIDEAFEILNRPNARDVLREIGNDCKQFARKVHDVKHVYKRWLDLIHFVKEEMAVLHLSERARRRERKELI